MTKDLIERLEAATGPDRWLDAHVFCALFSEPNRKAVYAHGGAAIIYGPGGEAEIAVFPSYTASLDASLVLVGEKLPGWHWGVTNTSDQPWHEAWVTPGIGKGSTGFGKNPALAVLIALLKALETK